MFAVATDDWPVILQRMPAAAESFSVPVKRVTDRTLAAAEKSKVATARCAFAPVFVTSN